MTKTPQTEFELLDQPVRCYIGLGSNLEDPLQQVRQALCELAELPHCSNLTHSRLYRSDPVGPPGQPDYINAVAGLDTRLQPLDLLDQLQALEQQHRRVRLQHWGPRTLDLDILLYADRQIDLPRLQVPHPHMSDRNFVLYPLQELEPTLRFPNGRSISDHVNLCTLGTLEPLEV
ncbi:2-amino-4-hydroxy-6-hydroxymethyldihydropteridine diphosphokinase [Motiliproteus coralliicola]|uniref:2-amino-4-hydroxy-6-hydroxymethyldihydropteridine pyrophosphokinase n=1 Tax=Motiliproteus coralliicola TaxID=2283196 RepID=A0A369WBQ2_9GAMM|nr:2-amino-4-hydroxy-6-hydroxymethyldihydropteridine diphosphokinase [Motiliproteus coralliicola]RDE18056.1 2-amino-4-hydroxy-6-hydroxymethyldihydropteridine diphosphokinase [Motiliproteus coralliicola]